MYPTLFISHGAPNIILSDIKSKQNIKKLANSLEKPKYIIIFSVRFTFFTFGKNYQFIKLN